jgi:hypothetical protein
VTERSALGRRRSYFDRQTACKKARACSPAWRSRKRDHRTVGELSSALFDRCFRLYSDSVPVVTSRRSPPGSDALVYRYFSRSRSNATNCSSARRVEPRESTGLLVRYLFRSLSAERSGFEPEMPVSRHTGLAIRRSIVLTPRTVKSLRQPQNASYRPAYRKRLKMTPICGPSSRRGRRCRSTFEPRCWRWSAQWPAEVVSHCPASTGGETKPSTHKRVKPRISIQDAMAK